MFSLIACLLFCILPTKLPAEELIVIYMSQQTHKRRYYRRMMRYLVSQAIID